MAFHNIIIAAARPLSAMRHQLRQRFAQAHYGVALNIYFDIFDEAGVVRADILIAAL